jgi:hypothetical protein
MRADVLAVLGQYKKEILTFEEVDDDTFGFVIQDWWHYLDDVAINAHDYQELGKITVNLYDWFEDVGTVDMIDTYTFTLEEFADL